MSELATLNIEGAIATLTINRPEQRNAMSVEMLEAMHACVDRLEEEASPKEKDPEVALRGNLVTVLHLHHLISQS